MGAANVDANGFMVGGQVLNMPCGNLAATAPIKRIIRSLSLAKILSTPKMARFSSVTA
jgi:hypothetical protein